MNTLSATKNFSSQEKIKKPQRRYGRDYYDTLTSGRIESRRLVLLERHVEFKIERNGGAFRLPDAEGMNVLKCSRGQWYKTLKQFRTKHVEKYAIFAPSPRDQRVVFPINKQGVITELKNKLRVSTSIPYIDKSISKDILKKDISKDISKKVKKVGKNPGKGDPPEKPKSTRLPNKIKIITVDGSFSYTKFTQTFEKQLRESYPELPFEETVQSSLKYCLDNNIFLSNHRNQIKKHFDITRSRLNTSRKREEESKKKQEARRQEEEDKFLKDIKEMNIALRDSSNFLKSYGIGIDISDTHIAITGGSKYFVLLERFIYKDLKKKIFGIIIFDLIKRGVPKPAVDKIIKHKTAVSISRSEHQEQEDKYKRFKQYKNSNKEKIQKEEEKPDFVKVKDKYFEEDLKGLISGKNNLGNLYFHRLDNFKSETNTHEYLAMLQEEYSVRIKMKKILTRDVKDMYACKYSHDEIFLLREKELDDSIFVYMELLQEELLKYIDLMDKKYGNK